MAELNKILHVEDDLDVQQIVEFALVDIGGFSVEQYSSGAVALSKATELTPDLLLLDVMMPEMSGGETLNELRKLPSYKNTPAIFITAKVQPDEVEKLLRAGAIAVIAKPFNPMTLADEIRGHWDTATQEAERQVISVPTEFGENQLENV
jgi:two-component system OmpR family response regulator